MDCASFFSSEASLSAAAAAAWELSPSPSLAEVSLAWFGLVWFGLVGKDERGVGREMKRSVVVGGGCWFVSICGQFAVTASRAKNNAGLCFVFFGGRRANHVISARDDETQRRPAKVQEQKWERGNREGKSEREKEKQKEKAKEKAPCLVISDWLEAATCLFGLAAKLEAQFAKTTAGCLGARY